jgi:hypothetical protein
MTNAVGTLLQAIRDTPRLYFGRRSSVADETRDESRERQARITYVFLGAWRALLEWLAHVILIVGIFASLRALMFGLRLVGVREDTRFFDVVPLQWLLDGTDLALLIALAVFGISSAVRSYRDTIYPK